MTDYSMAGWRCWTEGGREPSGRTEMVESSGVRSIVWCGSTVEAVPAVGAGLH